MSNPTQPTARPLGCPSWCELSPEQHEPTWHADALRVDHERVWRVQDAGTVVVGQEAIYHPEGAGLRLVLGPVGASCEAVEETLTAAGLRALSSALVEAAELVEALTAPRDACQCGRCGVQVEGARS